MQKVAVIDDDTDMLSMVARMLGEGGYEVMAFSNVDAAVAALEHTKVDVILTDIFMPRLDGFHLLALMRDSQPDVPIIAMSGGGSLIKVDMLPETKAFGAAAIIDKPFTSKQLIAVIQSTLNAR